MTKIKICGLKRSCDIAFVNEAKPDCCGFIIDVPQSPRNVEPKRVRILKKSLEDTILPVGVFVNASLPTILSLTEDGTLGAVQLHGQETETYIRELKTQTSLPVIKAFSISKAEDLIQAEKSPADLILLDHGKGGTGQSFDWTCLTRIHRPYFLAGGLTPQNIPEVLKDYNPYGVDLSSGVETQGYKDRYKILAAVAAVRRTNHG